ncbi:hypothetical protein HQ520_10560, partial [bacterium]|nr:hypothetical protein [bacterium]
RQDLNYGTDGGAGGGAIELSVAGTLTIGTSGGIRVNGGNGGDYVSFSTASGGGGSGGSILLAGDTVTNLGFLEAKGGRGGDCGDHAADRAGGGAGGGRIAVYYTSVLSAGSHDISGGRGGIGGPSGTQSGDPGHDGSFVAIPLQGDIPLRLPVPIDIPTGPAGVDAPGGATVPEMDGQPDMGSPAISMISEVTYPDETIVATGDNLDGAWLRIWTEDGTRDLYPLRTDTNRLQAILPSDLTTSTMLVWPYWNGLAGSPIRVNGPTVWWSWPCRLFPYQVGPADVSNWSIWSAALSVPKMRTAAAGDEAPVRTIRFMGKNLRVGHIQPRVWLSGPGVGQWLTIESSTPYHIEARLPRKMIEGTYQAWVHSGSGGPWGWSNPVEFDVVPDPRPENPTEFRVEDFGATPDDGIDDRAAIQSAVTAVANAGGGIVRFSQGTYNITGRSYIDLPAGVTNGIELVGVGSGAYNYGTDTMSGTYTAVHFTEGQPLPDALFRIFAPYSRVRNMTLINGADRQDGLFGYTSMGQIVMAIHAHDVRVEDCRIVLVDRRPDIPQDEREDIEFRYGGFLIDAPGDANIEILHTVFHSPGTCLQMADYVPDHLSSLPPPPRARYIRIADCTFRGHYSHFYKTPPPNDDQWAYNGSRRSAIVNYSTQNLIVENCDMAGADKFDSVNPEMQNRTMLCYNTSVRNVYAAHNNSHDMGVPSPPEAGGRKNNQGEQYLFHYRYPYGGYFDVLDPTANSVTVDPDDPRNDGTITNTIGLTDRTASRVLPEVGDNDNWVLFIAKGKGVGQFRVVTVQEDVGGLKKLTVDRPWRIVPDTDSRVVLTVVFRQNILYGNTVDSGAVDTMSKYHGILFWFNTYDNIYAGNTFRNLSLGVGLNSSFRIPTAWNLVRDNYVEHAYGYSGDTSLTPAFFTDHYRVGSGLPAGEEMSWYEIGNIFRSNIGVDGNVASYLHARGGSINYLNVPDHPDAGVMSSVYENNKFLQVDQGITVSRPVNWGLLRNNTVEPKIPGTAKTYDQSGGATEDLLIIE